MRIRNLTSKTINVITEEKEFVFPSEGCARVLATTNPFGEIRTEVESINGIPVVRTTYGEIEGLPEPEEGVVNIVSYVILNALKTKGDFRTDVVAPDTSPSGVARDEDGIVIGVKGFQRI